MKKRMVCGLALFLAPACVHDEKPAHCVVNAALQKDGVRIDL